MEDKSQGSCAVASGQEGGQWWLRCPVPPCVVPVLLRAGSPAAGTVAGRGDRRVCSPAWFAAQARFRGRLWLLSGFAVGGVGGRASSPVESQQGVGEKVAWLHEVLTGFLRAVRELPATANRARHGQPAPRLAGLSLANNIPDNSKKGGSNMAGMVYDVRARYPQGKTWVVRCAALPGLLWFLWRELTGRVSKHPDWPARPERYEIVRLPAGHVEGWDPLRRSFHLLPHEAIAHTHAGEPGILKTEERLQRMHEALRCVDPWDDAALDAYLLDPGPEAAPGARVIYKARTAWGRKVTISTESITVHGRAR